MGDGNIISVSHFLEIKEIVYENSSVNSKI